MDLKYLRNQTGLTQKQVAKKLCISESAWQKIETGKNKLNLSYVQPLCEMFQVSTQELLSSEDMEMTFAEENGLKCETENQIDKLWNEESSCADIWNIVNSLDIADHLSKHLLYMCIMYIRGYLPQEYRKTRKLIKFIYHVLEREPYENKNIFLRICDDAIFGKTKRMKPIEAEEFYMEYDFVQRAIKRKEFDSEKICTIASALLNVAGIRYDQECLECLKDMEKYEKESNDKIKKAIKSVNNKKEIELRER